MRALLLALALCAGVTPALAQQVVELDRNTLLEWDNSYDGKIFRFEDTDMRLELIYPADSRDWVEGVYLHVSSGGDAFRMHSEAGLSGFGEIGIFDIDRAGGPSIVFGAYTGGAHCCMAMQTALLTSDTPIIADLGLYDGSLVEPEDLNDDGLYEFRLWDGRFNYTFDAYAASFTPIIIFDTENGILRDVTTDREYYGYIKGDMRNQGERCGGSHGWYAAACAALAANAARVGRYEQVRNDLSAFLQSNRFDSGWDEFSFCVSDDCAQTRDFTDFVEALDFALENWGYL